VPARSPGVHQVGANFIIKIPSNPKKHRVNPHYVSASTQSMSIAVNGGPPTIVNLTPSSPNCTPASGSMPLTCTATVAAPVGNDTFAVITYDQENGAGNLLSENTISATILAGQANNVSITLNGVIASIQLALAYPTPQGGTPTTIPLAVNAMDADSTIIIGPGSYDNGPIALADSDTSGATTLSANSVGDPTVAVTVIYNGSIFSGGSATFSASAGGGSIQTSGGQNAVLRPINYWSTKASAPTTRAFQSAGVVNGMLYVAGGLDIHFHSLKTFEAYDPSTDSWTTKASMPTARADQAAGVVNGVLYEVGGVNGSVLNTVEAYDPSTDTWATKASMQMARYGLAIGVVNGKLYAVGGEAAIGVGSPVNTVEAYDPSTDTWTTKAPMPTARGYLVAGVANGILYAVGGVDSSGYPLNTIEAYDPVANTWTTKAAMPTARDFLAADVVNSILYTVGGEDSSFNYVNTVEAYTP
jgi:N-acetylneuraminic acid mutarotase